MKAKTEETTDAIAKRNMAQNPAHREMEETRLGSLNNRSKSVAVLSGSKQSTQINR